VEAGRRFIVVASLGLLSSSACAIRSSNESPTILLFNGSGTSPNDVAAIEKILSKNDFSYTTSNSRRLNEMGESQLRAYRLLIIPGQVLIWGASEAEEYIDQLNYLPLSS
jgi:hypothetical protein